MVCFCATLHALAGRGPVHEGLQGSGQSIPEPRMRLNEPHDIGEIFCLLTLPPRRLRPSLYLARERVFDRGHTHQDAMHVGSDGA